MDPLAGELLRVAVEQAPEAIYVRDLAGRYLYVNQATADLIGRPAAALIGQPYEAVVPPASAAFFREIDAAALATTGPMVMETMKRKADGEDSHYETTHQRCFDGQGRVYGLIGVSREVTDRISSERAMEVHAARIEAVHRMKDEVVSAISHDLRTPLTAVKGYLEFLSDELGGPLTPQQRDFVDHIGVGTARLERLVDDLLDFALVRAGELRLQLEPVELVALARRACGLLAVVAADRGVALALADAPDALWLQADAERVTRVLTNLIGNALKFTQAGGRVAVALTATPEGALVEVSDDGPGIAEASLPHVFERYYRGPDAAAPRPPRGSGMGLAIVQSLVEAHGGQVGVRSTLGLGSTFWFRLPAAPPDWGLSVSSV